MSMLRDHILSAIYCLALVACSGGEEVAPPPEPVLDPLMAAQVDRTREWATTNRAGCVADVVEVEMPGAFREECTFDSRGQLFHREDSRKVHTRADGQKELVLETVLEATTPNLMAARIIFGTVEVAALRKLQVRFSDSVGEIHVRLQGNGTSWVGSPDQRRRANEQRLVFPPSGATQP